MNYRYPDRKICWPDGTEIATELRDMLLNDVDDGLEIEHGEFAWNSDKSLSMTFRVSVGRRQRQPETWELSFTYPAEEATAAGQAATPEERSWFTMMVSTHLAEWRAGGPSRVVARQVK